ncbi:MAG: GDP-L-fucose synthase [Proteobacteria bacterium]|nr:GDP-L-fucose synthase [Pseudomonadota bacterium]
MDSEFGLKDKRIWVAGHTGMVGSAIVSRLAQEECDILTVPRDVVDLRRQALVEDWMASEKPDVVIVAAATVGGIHANDTRPAEFLYDNLAIETNIIHGAWRCNVQKLLFLGSACIYPRDAEQPMAEEALLTGPLEPTNEWYAIAKIAGIKMCAAYRRQYDCDFISAQPNNLYGPNDNFDLQSSHVIPALMSKFHTAKQTNQSEVEIWGSGEPKREFLYVTDLADALIFLLRHYSEPLHLNIGTGEEVTIRELANLIGKTVGYDGGLKLDRSKPDGAPRKLLDVSRMNNYGWGARTTLVEGLRQTYDWYLNNVD